MHVTINNKIMIQLPRSYDVWTILDDPATKMRMTSEVYQPTNGDALIKDTMTDPGADPFRPRPVTQGGYRFGQLSHNSFFTRHNPHPHRVRHLKGLLDVPICSVNDDGYFANPRYSLNFPPSNFNNSKMNSWKGRIPVNAVNVQSHLHPINTITGLQYFMGLNSYPWRERAVPRVGLVPVTEAWRDELKHFTEQLTNPSVNKEPAKESVPKQQEDERPKTTYSLETGRLLPPPSRAMSRGNSRRAQRMPTYPNFQHIAPVPDLENVVLTMLCQILQTEDVNAVQAWLCSAGEREKTMVMEMIKAAMAGREEYWKQYPALVMEDPCDKPKLPPINGAPKPSSGETNRLVLEEKAPAAPVQEPSKSPRRTVVDDKDFAIEAPINDVFRPPSPPKKPPSQQANRPPTVQAPAAPMADGAAPKPSTSSGNRLRYSKSPTKELGKDPLPMWNQTESVNTF